MDNRDLTSQLLLYRLESNRTVTRNGTTARVYDVVGVYDNAVSGSYGSATAASGRVIVGERGRILELETTVTYERGTLTYRYAHTRLGETSVEPPEWRRSA